MQSQTTDSPYKSDSACNWQKFFSSRPELNPPGYDETVNAIYGRNKVDLVESEEIKPVKKKETRPQIDYLPSRFKKGSLVTLRNDVLKRRLRYEVKTGIDPRNKLIKIKNTETGSIQWISEKNLEMF